MWELMRNQLETSTKLKKEEEEEEEKEKEEEEEEEASKSTSVLEGILVIKEKGKWSFNWKQWSNVQEVALSRGDQMG